MDDFQPLTETLAKGKKLRVQPGGGRSSSDFLPFFNVETGQRSGLVVGVGWSGEWAAEFNQTEAASTRIKAGLSSTNLKLRPGESIRTSRIALLFYEGNWVRGQNLWRRFVLDQHRPKVNGRPMPPLVFNANWGATKAADHLANIKASSAHQLPIDYYWIDAEWFGVGPWFQTAGNWRVKSDLYPQGFKPISDLLHQAKQGFLLWFEPERICPGTTWAAELRPEWLLTVPKERRFYNWGTSQAHPDWVMWESRRNQIRDGDRLFHLGIPEARQFLTDFIAARIKEFGLDCYRHDANIAPLEFWRAADGPDRRGMTEIRWVEGLYQFWDDLLRRHPHLLIDNCASGGRRIDLETLGRSTAFWRTDFAHDVTARQCHTFGISFWVPLNSTGAVRLGRDSDYTFRSTFSSCLVLGLFGNGDAPQAKSVPTDFPFARVKAAVASYRAIQHLFLGDYYPLTSYSKAADVWLAWQFDRPDMGEGLVQAFRRPKSIYESVRLQLQGLEASARYQVATWDTPTPQVFTGQELMEKGLPVAIRQQPGSAVLVYRKIP